MAGRASRVLLTGARGFTGRYLRRDLQALGYEVAGLIDSGSPGSDEYAADLIDADAIDAAVQTIAPTHVLHLAAVSYVAHGDVRGMYATNVLGTVNLLQALARLPGPPRTILASSANVYGNAQRVRIDETTPTGAINHYGASKLAMEAVVSACRDQLPCIVTRPFNYTGPGQAGHFLVPKIVAHFARRADRIELGNIDVERDFLDVRSVSNLYARLLGCDAAVGTTVNLCSGRGVTIRDLIATLERLTGHRMQIAVNPALVRAREIPRLVGCNARLRSLVGDWPAIELEQTLRDMLDVAV